MKVIAEGGEAELALRVVEEVRLAVFPPHSETCAWQPLPVRLAKGFGMKVARSPCFSASDLHHVFEEGVPVGGA